MPAGAQTPFFLGVAPRHRRGFGGDGRRLPRAGGPVRGLLLPRPRRLTGLHVPGRGRPLLPRGLLATRRASTPRPQPLRQREPRAPARGELHPRLPGSPLAGATGRRRRPLRFGRPGLRRQVGGHRNARRCTRGRPCRLHVQDGGAPLLQGRLRRPFGRPSSFAPPVHPSHGQEAPVRHDEPQGQQQPVVVVAPHLPAARVVRVQQADGLFGPVFQIRTQDVPEPLFGQSVMPQQCAHVLVQGVGLPAQSGAPGAPGQHAHGALHPLALNLGRPTQEILRLGHDLQGGGFELPVPPVPRGFGQLPALPGNEPARIPHDGEAGLEPLDAFLLRLETLHVAVQGPLDAGRQRRQGLRGFTDDRDVAVHPVDEAGQDVEVAVDLVPDLLDLDAPLRSQHPRRRDGFHGAPVLRRERFVAPDLDVEESRGGQQADAHQGAHGPIDPPFHGLASATVPTAALRGLSPSSGCSPGSVRRKATIASLCSSGASSPNWKVNMASTASRRVFAVPSCR